MKVVAALLLITSIALLAISVGALVERALNRRGPLDSLKKAEYDYLVRSGWDPRDGDMWVPPWDKSKVWSRPRAIERQRQRDSAPADVLRNGVT